MLANDIYLKELVKEANKKLKKSKEKIELLHSFVSEIPTFINLDSLPKSF